MQHQYFYFDCKRMSLFNGLALRRRQTDGKISGEFPRNRPCRRERQNVGGLFMPRNCRLSFRIFPSVVSSTVICRRRRTADWARFKKRANARAEGTRWLMGIIKSPGRVDRFIEFASGEG